MSHITKISLEITNRKYLIEALRRSGYNATDGKIETYDGTPTAEGLVVESMPSVGFIQGEDGKYEIHSDFYNVNDITREEFINKVTSYYSLAMATDLLRRGGVTLGRERVIGDTIEVEGTW